MKLNKTEVDRVDFMPADPATRANGYEEVLTLGDLRAALMSMQVWADDTQVIGYRGDEWFSLDGIRFEIARRGVIDIAGQPAADVPRETSAGECMNDDHEPGCQCGWGRTDVPRETSTQGENQ